jgi:hypothetical protein
MYYAVPHKEHIPFPVEGDSTQLYIIIGASGGGFIIFVGSFGSVICVYMRRRRRARNSPTRPYQRVAVPVDVVSFSFSSTFLLFILSLELEPELEWNVTQYVGYRETAF